MRLLSALSGVGVMAGAVMIPVQRDSDAPDISNQQHHDDDASHMKSFRKILSLILGKDLVSHPRLGHYMTFVLTNFLRFIAVYITFTHLPTFAMVSFRIYKVLSIKENAVLDPRNYCSQSSFSHLCWGNLQHNGQIHWRSLKLSDLESIRPLHMTSFTLAASLVIVAHLIPFYILSSPSPQPLSPQFPQTQSQP